MILHKYIFTALLIVVNNYYCLSQSSNISHPPSNLLILDTVDVKVYREGKLIKSSSKIQALAQFDNNEYFIYLDNAKDTTFSNPLKFFKASTDSVLFWNDVCTLIDRKLYINNNDSIEIFKYEYDLANAIDEEYYLYCNSSIGLIGLLNYPWGLFYFYESNKIPGETKHKLESDILIGSF